MNYQELKVGQKVFWNDPDRDLSSGLYKVTDFSSDEGSDTIVTIANEQGSTAEVYLDELTPKKSFASLIEKESEGGNRFVLIFSEPSNFQPVCIGDRLTHKSGRMVTVTGFNANSDTVYGLYRNWGTDNPLDEFVEGMTWLRLKEEI